MRFGAKTTVILGSRIRTLYSKLLFNGDRFQLLKTIIVAILFLHNPHPRLGLASFVISAAASHYQHHDLRGSTKSAAQGREPSTTSSTVIGVRRRGANRFQPSWRLPTLSNIQHSRWRTGLGRSRQWVLSGRKPPLEAAREE